MQHPIDSITQTRGNIMQLEEETEEDIVIRGELLKWTNYIHGWQVCNHRQLEMSIVNGRYNIESVYKIGQFNRL